MRLAVRGLAPSEIGALLRFYEEMYGRGSYQSSRRYFDWLYQENPAARGVDDCIVALDDGNIVGSVHRMRLPCLTPTGPATLTSLQNHVVSPKLRGGAGIMLLQRAVKGERVTLSPGVSGRLGEAYRRLGYDEVKSYWLMRVLSPIQAAFQGAGRTLSRGRWPNTRPRLSDRQLSGSNAGRVQLTLNPTGAQLARIAEFLVSQAREQAGAYVAWDAELVRWRYFSPTGPRHIFVEQPATRAWAVFSYGVKSRLNVARLLEHDAAGDRNFMHDVLRSARRIGASVGLAYTTRTGVKEQLLAAGWRLRSDPPSSFSFGAGGVSISGGATDVGFEALLTETTK
jgi:hypothetical protein